VEKVQLSDKKPATQDDRLKNGSVGDALASVRPGFQPGENSC